MEQVVTNLQQQFGAQQQAVQQLQSVIDAQHRRAQLRESMRCKLSLEPEHGRGGDKNGL